MVALREKYVFVDESIRSSVFVSFDSFVVLLCLKIICRKPRKRRKTRKEVPVLIPAARRSATIALCPKSGHFVRVRLLKSKNRMHNRGKRRSDFGRFSRRDRCLFDPRLFFSASLQSRRAGAFSDPLQFIRESLRPLCGRPSFKWRRGVFPPAQSFEVGTAHPTFSGQSRRRVTHQGFGMPGAAREREKSGIIGKEAEI